MNNNIAPSGDNSFNEPDSKRELKIIPRVLVADDDCDDTDMLSFILKEISPLHKIWCFNDAQMALQLFRFLKR